MQEVAPVLCRLAASEYACSVSSRARGQQGGSWRGTKSNQGLVIRIAVMDMRCQGTRAC